MHRIDMAAILEAYEDLQLVRLEQIKLPKLSWSCRSLNLLPKQVQVARNGRLEMTEKFITAGLCSYKGSERPFLARLSVTFSIQCVETPRKDAKRNK